MRVIYIPIEPLTERYTEQWYRRFPEAFQQAGLEVVTLDGTPLVHDDIKVGTFLDINSTVHYKMSQLQKIATMFDRGEVHPGDTFFFGDIEFWGLESVRLMAQMNQVPIKITGFLHAASYTAEDAFSIAAPYQRFTELGWIAACDLVFVGSEYHKQQVINERLALVKRYAALTPNKIVVTKNPIFEDEYPQFDLFKQKKMVLTNRLDAEKRPLQTLQLFADLKQEFPDWQFMVTSGRKTLRGDQRTCAFAQKLADEGTIVLRVGLTKEEYHRELAEASIMVSHSIEENYGYCIAEALHYGCLPLLKDNCSHPEFVAGRGPKEHRGLVNEDMQFLFSTTSSAYFKAQSLMRKWGTDAWPACPKLDTNGLARIVQEIENL